MAIRTNKLITILQFKNLLPNVFNNQNKNVQ